jgi:hypothetical protein
MNERHPAKLESQWAARPARIPAHPPARAIILADRERLPWRFFGRLTTAILAGLTPGR